MPRVLMLFIALHRLDCVAEPDFAWLTSIEESEDDDLGRYCHELRKRLKLNQTDFWARFEIAQPTGGRYERGMTIPPVARRLLSLYRAGRVDDGDLARAERWLRALPLPDPGVCVAEIGEADTRPGDLYAIRWMPASSNGDSGYLVAVKRRHQELTQWFGLSRFGSRLKALAAAQRWRDEVLASTPPISKREFVAKVRRNNTSGIAGVSRIIRSFKSATGRQIEYAVWAARPPRCLKGVSGRSFRVNEYGEAGARAQAIELRRWFEAQVEGFHAPHVPEDFLPDAPLGNATRGHP